MDQQVQAKKPNKVSNSIQKIKLRSLIFKLKLLINKQLLPKEIHFIDQQKH